MKLPYELFTALRAWVHARSRLAVAQHANNERHPGYPDSLVAIMRADADAVEVYVKQFFAPETVEVPAPELPADTATETTTEHADEPAENPSA